MSVDASARLAVWLGLIVAIGTAVAIVPASRTWHTSVVPSSAAEPAGTDTRPAWQIALETMDRALAAGDISGAEMAWRDAYGLPIRTPQWPALLAAGDGALRIGDRVLVKRPYRARAAEAWRTALFLARGQQSVDGVLQVARPKLQRSLKAHAAICFNVAAGTGRTLCRRISPGIDSRAGTGT